MWKKILIAVAAFLILATAAYAWTPPGDINLRSAYNIINGLWFNGTDFNATGYYYGSGSKLTDIQTYNLSYDAQLGHNTTAEIRAAVDPDTNASTACTGDEMLLGSGSCLGFVDGWNRTDQGNTTTEIRDAVNASVTYGFNATTAGTCGYAQTLDGFDYTDFAPFNGTLNSDEYIRAKGLTAPSEGVGLELGYSSISLYGRLFAFDRNLNEYRRLYFRALNYTFVVNETVKAVLDNTGLGIGITTPSELLDVSGNATINTLKFNDNEKTYFGNDDDVELYYNGTHFVIEST